MTGEPRRQPDADPHRGHHGGGDDEPRPLLARAHVPAEERAEDGPESPSADQQAVPECARAELLGERRVGHHRHPHPDDEDEPREQQRPEYRVPEHERETDRDAAVLVLRRRRYARR